MSDKCLCGSCALANKCASVAEVARLRGALKKSQEILERTVSLTEDSPQQKRVDKQARGQAIIDALVVIVTALSPSPVTGKEVGK